MLPTCCDVVTSARHVLREADYIRPWTPNSDPDKGTDVMFGSTIRYRNIVATHSNTIIFRRLLLDDDTRPRRDVSRDQSTWQENECIIT